MTEVGLANGLVQCPGGTDIDAAMAAGAQVLIDSGEGIVGHGLFEMNTAKGESSPYRTILASLGL